MISLFKVIVIDISAFPVCDGLQNVSSDEFILFYRCFTVYDETLKG